MQIIIPLVFKDKKLRIVCILFWSKNNFITAQFNYDCSVYNFIFQITILFFKWFKFLVYEILLSKLNDANYNCYV